MLWALLGISDLYAKRSDPFAEKPGKSVLYPYFELSEYNFKENPYRILFRENSLSLVSLDESISIQLKNITSLSLIKEVPRLRGELIKEFDKEDLSLLSKLYLRMKVKSNGEVRDYFLTLDFNISNEQQLKALREDLGLVNRLGLRSNLVVRKKADIYELLDQHRRDFYQFPLLSRYQGNIIKYQRFFSQLERNLKAATNTNYHTQNNHMSVHIFSALDYALGNYRPSSSRLFRQRGESQRYRALKGSENKKNEWRVIENLKIRNLPYEMNDFKLKRLQDEFCTYIQTLNYKLCAGNFLGNLLHKNQSVQIKSRFEYIRNEMNNMSEAMVEFASFLKGRTHKYIHKKEQHKLDAIILKVIALDDYILQTLHLTQTNLDVRSKDIENNLLRIRIFLWSGFLRPIINHNDYNISRFYQEGHFYKVYAPKIFEDALRFIKQAKSRVSSFNWDIIEMSELAPFVDESNFLSEDRIESGLDKLVATEIETKGTDLGEGLVNILGQVFKKRDWVPYLRVPTMFRDNFMTSRRKYIYSHLFKEDGMKPGDIILKKDLQANTDVLIPGYWIHAALYVGSVNDLKKLGLWDDPKMAVIRYEIELYKTSQDRQYYLNTVWKNNLPFDDIPWFFESDRPGVGVHPLHKFMQTDGMAVLRPNHNYDLVSKKKVFYRANERMYFPYDYVHNVRNKFSVSCSKVILKIFDDITFPVTKYLSYVSVSPDQIGQPISLDTNHFEQGELKLIMFFDAENKGELMFHHNKSDTHDAYYHYLESTGII